MLDSACDCSVTHGWWRGALHRLWAARMLSSILSAAVGSSPSAACTCGGVHVQAPNICPLQDHVHSLEGSFCGLIHDPMPVTCCALCLVHAPLAPPLGSAKSASHHSCPLPSACCLPSSGPTSPAAPATSPVPLHAQSTQRSSCTWYTGRHGPTSAYMRAFRLMALLMRSKTSMAAPSPMTNPRRSLSKGREASWGSLGCSLVKARILQHTDIDGLAHGLACGSQVRHMKCPGPATMQDRLCRMPCLPC